MLNENDEHFDILWANSCSRLATAHAGKDTPPKKLKLKLFKYRSLCTKKDERR
ncbi:MAG: hypothetical protein NZ455_07500 [Bacteroidia bacterium]|nr:hypothetical protein [Bacteroidia bacterium]MDW8346514.1 hypothetical protein [Bacteroidia bacterium]